MNQDATIFPVKYLKGYHSNNKDLLKVMYSLEQMKELVYRKKMSLQHYVDTFSHLQTVLQQLLKTNNMVGATFVESDSKLVVNLFEMDYSFSGMPLEILYGNAKDKMLYVQEIQDYINNTMKKVVNGKLED